MLSFAIIMVILMKNYEAPSTDPKIYVRQKNPISAILSSFCKFYLYGQIIDNVNESKILGCIFDKQLRWNIYVRLSKTTCMTRLNILKEIKAATCGLHLDLLLNFYVII